jgi:hypothetical protein
LQPAEPDKTPSKRRIGKAAFMLFSWNLVGLAK